MAGSKEQLTPDPKDPPLNFPEPVESRVIFTPEALIKLISSQKFTRALVTAANYTATTGHETAFKAEINPKGETYIRRVFAGNSEGTDAETDTIVEEIDGDDSKDERVRFFDFHFHPDPTVAITPSSQDARKFMNPALSFMTVGEIDFNGNVGLLICRRPNLQFSIRELSNYEIDSVSPHSQTEIRQSLGYLGIQTSLVNLTAPSEGKYILSSAAQAEIRKLDPVEIKFN